MVGMQVNKEVTSYDTMVSSCSVFLILKKDKDPSACGNYRPLSLLNTEIKLFAKVLARRLDPLMTDLVHHDQTGFIKSRFALDNVCRLLHIIEGASCISTPCAVLSVDAEKAFDRLEWHFLWQVLHHMGFGTHYISMIKVLYFNPIARILVGGTLSDSFTITRGTRQGCPLSPLLFALSLEPLAQVIRLTHDPINVYNTNHHLSLYADDLLLFVNDTTTQLPVILNTSAAFGDISDYKINWSKSAMLPLNNTATSVSPITNIPIVKQFRYLGLNIFPSITKIITDNYGNTLNTITTDLERWSTIPQSIQARFSVIKMIVMPRINFYSSMLPLSPPSGYWNRLHSAINKFIWNNKTPRIKYATLQRARDSGGQNLPNFKHYFWSFTMRALCSWLNPRVVNGWRTIEESRVHPYRLEDVIFSNIPPKNLSDKFGPIISNLLSVWWSVEEIIPSPKFHPYVPLFNNHSISICGNPISFSSWSGKGIHILSDIIHENRLRAFQELKQMFNLPGNTFFFYLQLRSAFNAYGVPWGTNMDTPTLYRLYTSGSHRKPVSKLYDLLRQSLIHQLSICNTWAHDLKQTNINWSRVWSNIRLSSRNPDHQMIHYNYVLRTHLTPQKLAKFSSNHSPNCTYCTQGTPGTYLHIMWDCSEINAFWRSVLSLLSTIIGKTLPFTPVLILLNDDSDCHLSVPNRRILLAGITAAKKMVATRWKQPHILNIPQWLTSFVDILHLEISVAKIHGAITGECSSTGTSKRADQSIIGFIVHRFFCP